MKGNYMAESNSWKSGFLLVVAACAIAASVAAAAYQRGQEAGHQAGYEAGFRAGNKAGLLEGLSVRDPLLWMEGAAMQGCTEDHDCLTEMILGG